jgi:outer membrane protein assembly factor BamB
MRRTAAWVVMLAALVTACSTSEKPKPTPLEPLTARIQASEAWRTRVDNVAFPLAVPVTGDRIVLATNDGTVGSRPSSHATPTSSCWKKAT